MKHATRRLIAPLLLVALAPVSMATQAPASVALVTAPMLQESVRLDDRSDKDRLNDAADVLRSRGFQKEARQLRKIAKELDAPDSKHAKAKLKKAVKKIDARAKKLLKSDINEVSNRIKMLDLLADGHAAVGNEAAADALRFFVSVGRAEADGSQPLAMPDSLSQGAGTTMDRLTHLVQSGQSVLGKAGSKRGALVAKRLGEFYVNRASGRGAEQQGADVEPSPPMPKVSDFVTIERRAPVLTLAASVFAGPGSDAAVFQRLGWAAAMAKARVSPDEAKVPETPYFEGMTQFIEDIDHAGRILLRRGSEHKGQLCLKLAEYYRLRSRGEINDDSATPPQVAAPQGVEARDLAARRDALEAQAAELREEIRRLKAELSGKGTGGK